MIATATFALGCFWDPDARFGALAGVLVTRVGFCGGTHPDTPTYRSIGDYTESVQIEFDPARLSFPALLAYFDQWHHPNASSTRPQYAAAVFYHNDEQRQETEKLKMENVRLDRFVRFYLAEESHQKYNLKRTLMLTDLFGKKEDWGTGEKDPQMLTKLNGFLAGYGTKEQFQQWEKRREFTREQQDFIKNKLKEWARRSLSLRHTSRRIERQSTAGTIRTD